MKDLSQLDKIIIGRVEPHIYAFTTNTIPNYLKVGDTYRPVERRLKEWEVHFPNLVKQFEGTAKLGDSVYFRDYAVHSFLENEKRKARLLEADLPEETYYSKEFFRDATAADVEEAIADISENYANKTGKYQYYDVATQLPTTEKYASTGFWDPRPNQKATIEAFKNAVDNGRTHLLMYAVMRFGKSFTSMCCAKEMDAKLVVVVSAKADVQDEWRKTVESADNFRNDYEFLSADDLAKNYSIVTEMLDHPTSPKRVVLFLTLQDLQGDNIKSKHQQIFGRKIDLLLVDETHYGARAEKYGAVLRNIKGDKEKVSAEEKYAVEDILEETKSLDVKITLHLSGTPYRILMSDEFDTEQDLIAFYQFTDIVHEQEAWDIENFAKDEPKEEWENPYYGFPQMVRFAFHPNESTRKRMEALRENGMSDAFSALFEPKSVKKATDGSHKLFVHEQEILELLEVIDGSKEDDELLGFLDYDKIKDGQMCRHIVCVLPYCAACDALEALIRNNLDRFKNLNTYEIVNISGVDNPNRYKKPGDIKAAIKEHEANGRKTITLTVNRMLTGSTVPQWDTMLFLKDTASPQEYDQAIFRLQNQYIKTLESENGKTIKFNMKPQTLLVDFDPNRVFVMQEQKAQVYNVNVDEAGNSRLRDRLEAELRISPIIVMNKDKLEEITAADILKAVSEYSKNRGVAEETVEIPVDMSLMDYDAIRQAIERENELGSKAGFTIKGSDGEGDDLDVPEELNEPQTTEPQQPGDTTGTNPPTEPKDTTKDAVKQFRSYYARILFFAFLTKNEVMSLEDIVDCIDTPINIRIATNLGIHKPVLKAILEHADKFVLRKLDYKIQNLNQLSHDETVDPIVRASVSVQKFGKLGESEVITPKHICNDMVGLISDAEWETILNSNNKVLDIAGKAGEFALAICQKAIALGCNADRIRELVYTIPTSGVTYEFTRMIYEILGLNIDNIATKFNSYSLLEVKDEEDDIDYERIKHLICQNKPFDSITLLDEITEGDDKVNFDVVIGNPPYHEAISDATDNASLGKQLFPWFVICSTKISNAYTSLITPSRWFTGDAQDKSFIKLRAFMKDNNHVRKIVNFKDEKELFSNVEIKGGISYFLYQQTYDGQTEFVNSYQGQSDSQSRNLFEDGLDIIISDSINYPIICKVKTADFIPLTTITTGRNAFGIIGKPSVVNSVSKDTPFAGACELRCKANVIRYIKDDAVTKSRDIFDKYKVFISKSAGNPNSDAKVIGYPYVGVPKSACTDSLFPIGKFDTLAEAENLATYLKTKFLRYMVSILKTSQNVTQIVYGFVPMQDFTPTSDINWNESIENIDKQLYTKYGLSGSEIEVIETTIKPME